jgi:hypothetical protein
MRRATIFVAAITGLALVVSVTGAGKAGAQQPDHCLDNSGEYSVNAGVQYADADGAWVCAPGSVSASAGGWIRLEPQPTPVNNTPAVAVANTTNPATNNGTHHGGIGVLAPSPRMALIGVGAVLVTALVALLAVRQRSAPRLTGTVKLEEVRRGQR